MAEEEQNNTDGDHSIVGFNIPAASDYLSAILQVSYGAQPITTLLATMEADENELSPANGLKYVYESYMEAHNGNDAPYPAIGVDQLLPSMGWDADALSIAQDPLEFLLSFLDAAERNGGPLGQAISELAVVHLGAEVTCESGDHQHPRDERSHCVNVTPRRDIGDLSSALKFSMQPEEIDGYRCDECGDEPGTATMRHFLNPPAPGLLFMSISRQNFNFETFNLEKQTEPVRFDRNGVVDLSVLMRPEEEDTAAVYRFHGAVLHSGTMNRGTLGAVVRIRDDDAAPDTWCHVRNTTAHRINPEDADAWFTENVYGVSDRNDATCACLLVWSRVDLTDGE